MWEPRRLTTLWASTTCYRASFTFYLVNLRYTEKYAENIKYYFIYLYFNVSYNFAFVSTAFVW
jgi:hypothetical protein